MQSNPLRFGSCSGKTWISEYELVKLWAGSDPVRPQRMFFFLIGTASTSHPSRCTTCTESSRSVKISVCINANLYSRTTNFDNGLEKLREVTIFRLPTFVFTTKLLVNNLLCNLVVGTTKCFSLSNKLSSCNIFSTEINGKLKSSSFFWKNSGLF